MSMFKKMLALTLSITVIALTALAIPGKTAVTTIQVEGMHCGGCASRVATELKEIPGVADVDADVEESSIAVSADSKASPSLRAIWEAIEKAGFKPIKISGPAGTFDSMPSA